MSMPDDAQSLIQSILNTPDTLSGWMVSMRGGLPGISVTACDAADMGEEEVAWFETALFQVYLLDTREHCVRLTADPRMASGLILARKSKS